MTQNNENTIFDSSKESNQSAQSDTDSEKSKIKQLEERIETLEEDLEGLVQEVKPTVEAVETKNGIKILVSDQATRWYNVDTIQSKIDEVAQETSGGNQ